MKGVLLLLILVVGGGAAAYYYDDLLRARFDAAIAPLVSAGGNVFVSSSSAAAPGMPIAVFAFLDARAADGQIERGAWEKMIRAGAAEKFRKMSGADGELTIHETLGAEEKVQPDMWLNAVDKNGDGGADLAEMASDKRFFAQADADGNGKVSAAEWWDLYSRYEWQWFQKSDLDGNGKLNEKEYLRGKKLSAIARENWTKADSDRNGILTKSEIDARLKDADL